MFHYLVTNLFIHLADTFWESVPKYDSEDQSQDPLQQ